MRPKVCGIICEYNPFHLGHQYQLDLAREKTGADYIIAVMSGPFTQRGEQALFSPATRARMALACGADVVLELPAAFAVREAEAFALGGAAILEKLGCVTHLCFGAENPEDELFADAAERLNRHDESLETFFREEYEKGLSFPEAMGRALTRVLQPSDPGFFSKPNNLLALSYHRALQKLGSGIIPVSVQRFGSYHGASAEGFASASSLRDAYLAGNLTEMLQNMPEAAAEIARQEIAHRHDCPPKALDLPLLYRLRRMTAEQAAELPFVSEGLENKLLTCAKYAVTREELLTLLKSRRYSYLRLSRLCCHALLDTTKALLDAHPLPEYARVLGFRKSAAPLFALMREGSLPLPGCDGRKCESPLLKIDENAYDLWALGAGLKAGMLYTEKMIVFE